MENTIDIQDIGNAYCDWFIFLLIAWRIQAKRRTGTWQGTWQGMGTWSRPWSWQWEIYNTFSLK